MQDYVFNDSNIKWSRLDVFDNFEYSILNVDHDNKVIDVLFRFAANNPIVLHRHCAVNHTFVIQGEHCLYHPDGRLKERRQTGSYTISQPDEEPHTECGGDTPVVVLFSIRGTDGVMYQILSEQQEIIAELGFEEFEMLYQQQFEPAAL
ncbi:hypothetical protein MPL1_12968 [Methylophaga lonarensis MPL]|uniref:ChrR-like cupin domain-containing protein n=1 Tax=Methylophaga lonarensis MPL TaxID=1286106 RepID=M7NT25_9GAMM|nr:hypothetical protein [Methylophaga lonarensis]EMR11923.1 hypothetical protein MPL1_12968 [Methylophaga lonarensis MPL]